MSFDGLIRSALETADSLTADLQATVSHEAWQSQDAMGQPTYAAAVDRLAIVEQRLEEIRDANGREVLTQAKVTFLRPIPPEGTAGRVEPVDQRDRLTLPDGTKAPIVKVEGLTDPDTTRPYMLEVWLGAEES